MTNIVDNNSLRINYLCPTGMIPVFYNLKSEIFRNSCIMATHRLNSAN